MYVLVGMNERICNVSSLECMGEKWNQKKDEHAGQWEAALEIDYRYENCYDC